MAVDRENLERAGVWLRWVPRYKGNLIEVAGSARLREKENGSVEHVVIYRRYGEVTDDADPARSNVQMP